MHVVATVVSAHVSMFELAVSCEVFGMDRSDLVDPWYDHRVCAASAPPLTTTEGVVVQAPYGLAELAQADTIVIAAWPVDSVPMSDELLDGLRRANRRRARIMSVCTGAFVLAAAGLLDGRPATTHWMYADELARRYPKVSVDRRVLYIDDGDILTSAGTAAGIDLCLHVVRLDHGAEVANAVARRMVVPPHRDGGQAQYVDLPVPSGGTDDGLGDLLGWMLEHLDQPLHVDELARRAAMSPRTFARRFRATTGSTPHQWLLSQRVLYAQRLLESSDAAVEQVAAQCGFSTAASLRAQFKRELGASPQAYRRTFHQSNGT